MKEILFINKILSNLRPKKKVSVIRITVKVLSNTKRKLIKSQLQLFHICMYVLNSKKVSSKSKLNTITLILNS